MWLLACRKQASRRKHPPPTIALSHTRISNPAHSRMDSAVLSQFALRGSELSKYFSLESDNSRYRRLEETSCLEKQISQMCLKGETCVRNNETKVFFLKALPKNEAGILFGSLFQKRKIYCSVTSLLHRIFVFCKYHFMHGWCSILNFHLKHFMS